MNRTEISDKKNSPEDWKFHCRFCGATFFFENQGDPTSSSGSCPCCGSDQWIIYDSEGVPLA